MATTEQHRRSALSGVRARTRAPWAAEPPFLVFLRWGDGTWLVPFATTTQALAYFAKADEIGIDYDYGACFDVASDPSSPRLVWEMPGKSSATTTTTTTSGGPMYGLVGRGHGGHGGGHRGGGGGRGRRPGIRRGFGGGWYGYYPYWPYYPAYGAAYDEGDEDDEVEVISGRHHGGHHGGGQHHRRRRPQVDQYGDQGAYGAPPPGLLDYPGDPDDPDDEGDPQAVVGARLLASADNELVSTLPVLAPGANGLSCQIDLAPDLQLHVRICVDGRCYETQADVSEAMSAVAQDVADAHGGAAPAGDPAESPAAVSEMTQRADQVVKSAGVALIGALYDQHLGTIAGGWFDSIKDAVRTIASPITVLTAPVVKEVGNTLKNFKGPISAAAGAIATAYGGPAGGAAAAQLTGPLIDSMAETGGDPTQFIDGILSHAGGDPVVHQAVSDAQRAVSHATAAYHLTSTAQDAARGDGKAGRKIAELDSLASGGDQGAMQAMMIIAQAFQAMMSNAASAQVSDMVTSGALPRQSRALADQLRRAASRSAQDHHRAHGMTVLGYVKYADSGVSEGPSGATIIHQDTEGVVPFDSVDEADDWLGSLDTGEVLYAAYFDASDPLWPHPLNEKLGYRRVAPPLSVAVRGLPVLPLVAAAAAGAGGLYAWQHYKAARAAHQAAAPVTSGALGVLPWLAMAAAGGAGWTGRGWWEQRRAAQAALAQSTVPPPIPGEPPTEVHATPPHFAPTATSGWW